MVFDNEDSTEAEVKAQESEGIGAEVQEAPYWPFSVFGINHMKRWVPQYISEQDPLNTWDVFTPGAVFGDNFQSKNQEKNCGIVYVYI